MIYILILSVGILLVTFLVTIKIPGSANHISWKLSGIWSNHANSFQVIIHEENSLLFGHIVSAQVSHRAEHPIIGRMVVKQVRVRSAWRWSHGKYIDPFTEKVWGFKMKLKDRRTLLVNLSDNQGEEKNEEWKLVDSL